MVDCFLDTCFMSNHTSSTQIGLRTRIGRIQFGLLGPTTVVDLRQAHRPIDQTIRQYGPRTGLEDTLEITLIGRRRNNIHLVTNINVLLIITSLKKCSF